MIILTKLSILEIIILIALGLGLLIWVGFCIKKMVNKKKGKKVDDDE